MHHYKILKNRHSRKGHLRSFFLMGWVLLAFSPLYSQEKPINRYEVVSRHNVRITGIEAMNPLSVGNGNFAFTVDPTGLQTFENFYHDHGIPLETLCTWAWHSFPNKNGYTLKDASKEQDFHGRKISYASLEKSPAGQYFRKNPQPIPLGQISLADAKGQPVDTSALKNISQILDLWSGEITSSYSIGNKPVTVTTVSHPELSEVAVSIKSDLLKQGKIKPRFRFAYAYDENAKNKPGFDWTHQDLHTTTVLKETSNSIQLKRVIDDSIYYVRIEWKGGKLKKVNMHEFILEGNSGQLSFTCNFSAKPAEKNPDFQTTENAGKTAWKNFWMKGGIADFTGSTDPRAAEMERRIILSLYLMKVNYSGNFPPQEDGLTNLTWYGKHNSEMYFWHSAQFYQWGRTELLENGLSWYLKILPKAQSEAKKEGFEGARWPKMSGLDGEPTPGGINPFIIWNQPNTIYLSELVYRAHKDKATLEKYSSLVFESAKFLASYAFYDANTDRYILGPPIKSVTEKNAENSTQNPCFELAQWYHSLSIAQEWRKRLGLPEEPKWNDILKKLSKLPVQDSLYLELETERDIFKGNGDVSSAMIMALGYLPQTPMVNPKIMKKTFDLVVERNGIPSFNSWSQAKGAMTAARLGETKVAVEIMCNTKSKNVFQKNGHVQRPKEPMGCPAYLPVNSSYLSAAGLMIAGWDQAPAVKNPGFPNDGTWRIKWEGLNPLP